MSRSTANWFFVVSLVIIGCFFSHPSHILSKPSVDETVDLIGVAISCTGLFLRVISREWKIAKGKQDLVTSGPYSVIRHPLYIGSFLAGLGLCLVLGSIAFLAAYIVCFLWVHYCIARSEERYLSGHWADKYPKYMKTVPGWLPSPVRLFSWLKSGSWFSCLHRKAVIRESSSICGVLAGAILLDVWSDYAARGWGATKAEALIMLAAAFAIIFTWTFCIVGLKVKRKLQ